MIVILTWYLTKHLKSHFRFETVESVCVGLPLLTIMSHSNQTTKFVVARLRITTVKIRIVFSKRDKMARLMGSPKICDSVHLARNLYIYLPDRTRKHVLWTGGDKTVFSDQTNSLHVFLEQFTGRKNTIRELLNSSSFLSMSIVFGYSRWRATNCASLETGVSRPVPL